MHFSKNEGFGVLKKKSLHFSKPFIQNQAFSLYL